MICEIVDIIKDKDDFPCIIMEKCNLSLDNIIKNYNEEYIPEKQVVRIFTMICIPLFHIHSKKMIHCDLKPENIIMKTIGN